MAYLEQVDNVDETTSVSINKVPDYYDNAPSILKRAQEHMDERAQTYDAPSGERSMAKTISAFNAINATSLSVEQGWQFMALLKIVRSTQGKLRLDNYEDLAAYAALMGEAAGENR